MSSTGRVRLFVAASVPVPLLELLERATSSLRRQWPAARWVPPANQHVTLKFLGWVDEGLIVDVHDVVARVARGHEPAELALGETGVFPGPTRARVLWVGLKDPDDLLRRAAGGLDAGFSELGFDVERRPFRPHLTLARFKEQVRVGPPLPELVPGNEQAFRVATIELFRSHLSPRGARYEVLRSFPLGGRAHSDSP